MMATAQRLVWVGWLSEDNRFCMKSFYFIDMHPGEVNAIMTRARRCLPAGQLIGLAFDPLAHSEGWGEGVMAAPTAALPFIPSSHYLSIPSAALYPSLSCFPPHKCLLKTPVRCVFMSFKGLYCAKSHING